MAQPTGASEYQFAYHEVSQSRRWLQHSERYSKSGVLEEGLNKLLPHYTGEVPS